ncbi:MAG: hypothetical protein WCC98_11205 [Candidatus Acidiferrales bacterium]
MIPRFALSMLAVFALIAVSPLQGALQQAPSNGILVDSSPQLFAVMCALDASGFDADSSTLADQPELAALRQRLLQLHGPATDAMRQFYHDHALKDSSETLSRFVSFALVVGPPPTFTFQLDQDVLPSDVLTLEGFNTILTNFYREAHLDREWTRVSGVYDRQIEMYEGPVRQTLFLAAGYLRELEQPSHGRTFSVFVEPLSENRVNFRNYAEHYSIVVGSTSQVPVDSIRHAYLHFMIDPLVLKYRPDIDRRRDLLQIATKAPLLPLAYQEDFFNLFDECMVKAVELRLRRLSPTDLESALTEDDRTGLILVRPLVTQLKLFEKEGPAMQYYFPDIVKGINVDVERDRLKNVKFAAAGAAKPEPEYKPAAPPPSNLDHDLDEGDHQIALQNGAAAQQIFEAILATHPGLSRAEYGLAMASVLQGRASRAEQLFQELVSRAAGNEAGPVDPGIIAWSHVYLGRIHDLQGDRDLALAEYGAALGVDGAPEAARLAAQRGQSVVYSPSGSTKPDASDKP